MVPQQFLASVTGWASYFWYSGFGIIKWWRLSEWNSEVCCTARLHQLTSNAGCALNKAAAEANFLLKNWHIAFFMKIDSDGADVCLSVRLKESLQFKESVCSYWSETFLAELQKHKRAADRCHGNKHQVGIKVALKNRKLCFPSQSKKNSSCVQTTSLNLNLNAALF